MIVCKSGKFNFQYLIAYRPAFLRAFAGICGQKLFSALRRPGPPKPLAHPQSPNQRYSPCSEFTSPQAGAFSVPGPHPPRRVVASSRLFPEIVS